MNAGPRGFGSQYKYEKVPPPRNFGDVFRYLKQLLGGFFKRFGYIVGIVWKTGPWILFLLSFLALLKGVTPIIGSLISKSILNELQGVIAEGGRPVSEFWGSTVLYKLISNFLFFGSS